MAIARDDLDQHGLIIGVSPERFRAVAMPLLFDHLNAQCEGTIAVNRQARIVWINDKYAEKVGISDPRSVLGKEIEDVLPASRLREVVESGQPSMLDLMAFGSEHFVVTRIPLRDEDGTLVGALGFVLFDRARHLKPLMAKFNTLQSQLVATQHELAKARRARYTIAGFIGASTAASEVKRQARRAAQLDATVLLRGETGTGKELLAQGIHNLSPRANGPFVAVNVAAIPETLVEAELFGTAPGAFTGADRKARIGKFEVANGGTLFLDEIGDLPLPLQAKLLRFLQERVIERVGGRQEIPVDVRIVCATHQDLKQLTTQGRFREDLYYRLAEIVVNIPPLRARVGDAVLIAHAFVHRFCAEQQRPALALSPEAAQLIEQHTWPGNIRELENCIKRACIMAEGKRIVPEDLGLSSSLAEADTGTLDLRAVREAAERKAVLAALARVDGNVLQAAELLGVSRPTLYDLMHRLGLR